MAGRSFEGSAGGVRKERGKVGATEEVEIFVVRARRDREKGFLHRGVGSFAVRGGGIEATESHWEGNVCLEEENEGKEEKSMSQEPAMAMAESLACLQEEPRS